MLTHKPDPTTDISSQQPNRITSFNRAGTPVTGLLALLVAGSLFAAFYTLLVRANFTLLDRPVGWQSTINTIGRQLMTEYVLPFEIVGILLLAALVGATYLAFPMIKSTRHATRR